VTFVVKQATNRERPDKERGTGGFWKGGTSFPSGHASTSFAAATVFAYEYGDKKWVPVTAYSLASLVSAARVSGQKHYFGDIAAGGVLGFVTGRYIYRQHHDPRVAEQHRSKLLSADIGLTSSVRFGERPWQVANARGLSIGWTF
jgi:membrane-associated phospholipid phosphatase